MPAGTRTGTIRWTKGDPVKVRDLMTRDVLTLTPETPLKRAAELLARERISGAPVVDDDGRVVGVLSEADVLVKASAVAPRSGLLGWLLEPAADYHDKIAATRVEEAMSTPVVTIAPDRGVHEAASLMIDLSVNRLPVIEDRELVGIVTRADIVRAFTRTDAQIADEIRGEILERTLWVEPGKVTMQVVDGTVLLVGELESEADAELLPVLVARVPGVVSVRASLRARATVAS
jgi:CBS domain-containing protein